MTKKSSKKFDVSCFSNSCKFYTSQPMSKFADSLEKYLKKTVKINATGMFEIVEIPYVPEDSFMMVDSNGKPIGMFKNVDLEI